MTEKFQVLVFTNNEWKLPECSEEFCVCNVPDKRKGTFRGIKEATRFAAVASLIHCLEARSAGSDETGCKVSIAEVGLGGIPKQVSRKQRKKFDEAVVRYAGEFMRFGSNASAEAEGRHPEITQPEITRH